MNKCGLLLILFFSPVAAAEWSLSDYLDRVLLYDSIFMREYTSGPRLIRTALPDKDGRLKPYAAGMEIQGQLRPGQILISAESPTLPMIAEFVVQGGTRLNLDYGLCDKAQAMGNKGTILKIELLAGDKTVTDTVPMVENKWSSRTIPLPKADRVLVRMIVIRRPGGSTNWTGLVLKGDGQIGPRELARKLSTNKERINQLDMRLRPSPFRVIARPGYDILFYRDRPFLSYAVKGHTGASHEYMARLGVNTFYNEALTFTTAYWPEGATSLTVPEDSPIHRDLWLCQRYDMPFKAPLSMAHCCVFLPPWLVKKENLGLEGHHLRKGGDTHTSFIKPATLRYHKLGLEGWVKPFLEQPTIFVFGQEDDASLWDDYSKEAVASWRSWLKRRFAGDFTAFCQYVGGVRGVTDFEAIPQPKRFEPDERFGYPMRLAYLKLLWVTESYGDYLAELFAFMRKKAPGIPLTQRFVNWANAPYICKRVKFDYNYTFGHLSVEGIPNNYGIGKKCWTGIYAHMGTLPLPRGGSIGKTYSSKIRRGPMNRTEWALNAYTSIANGCSGFEYSPMLLTWGPQWEPAALYDANFNLTPTGQAGLAVMKDVLACAPYMMHYEQYPDVAVFHDASFNTGPFAGPWSQSKVGIYALIRETGFHADPLTEWDMTPENLRGRKVLLLAGSVSLAPEIQAAVRKYVQGGGTLICVFCADGPGFPGCNSYAYACKPRESASYCSFENPKAVAHLGDVLGITEGGGSMSRRAVHSEQYGIISLDEFNVLVTESRWVNQPACCARLVPRPEARIVAFFDDGSPAVIENRFGSGLALTFAFDLGIIANNLTMPALYRWWSDLLLRLGCRKAVDTGNWYVEAGAWHDDVGNRLIILINHDSANPQEATLPSGKKVRLEPGGTMTVVETQRQG